MRYYNKLVRDKIPSIIESHDEEPIIRTLSGDELTHRLLLKVREELNELIAADNRDDELKEFAYFFEVLEAYRKNRKFTQAEVMDARRQKNELRGKFKSGVFLVGVRKPRTEEELLKDIEADELAKKLADPIHSSTLVTLKRG